MANISGRKEERGRKISIDSLPSRTNKEGSIYRATTMIANHEVLFHGEDDLIEGRNKKVKEKKKKEARRERRSGEYETTTASSRVGLASSLALG